MTKRLVEMTAKEAGAIIDMATTFKGTAYKRKPTACAILYRKGLACKVFDKRRAEEGFKLTDEGWQMFGRITKKRDDTWPLSNTA